MIWRPNDFPYYLEDGVQHDCIWFEAGAHTDRAVADAIAVHRPPADFEAVWWVNPPHLMSIPELHHVHVISRRRE